MEQGLKQVAALPYRLREELEICLITSRRTSRPIIPKGWPVKGLSDGQAAAREPYEEAGLKGRVDESPLGHYAYWKRRPSHSDLIDVVVFPLKVRRRRHNWPEKGQRCSAWMPAEAAAALVDDAGLAVLIRVFAARFARGCPRTDGTTSKFGHDLKLDIRAARGPAHASSPPSGSYIAA